MHTTDICSHTPTKITLMAECHSFLLDLTKVCQGHKTESKISSMQCKNILYAFYRSHRSVSVTDSKFKVQVDNTENMEVILRSRFNFFPTKFGSAGTMPNPTRFNFSHFVTVLHAQTLHLN